MTLPNFLVIGATKSGTTSLYTYLKQHPEVYMPMKEPNFFALEGREPPFFRGPEGWKEPSQKRITDLEGYRTLFAGASGEKAMGEVSPLYLYAPQAAYRIRRYVPEAKLVAILRNPVERAYSAYMHLVREDREPLGFAEALKEEERRIQSNWGPE